MYEPFNLDGLSATDAVEDDGSVESLWDTISEAGSPRSRSASAPDTAGGSVEVSPELPSSPEKSSADHMREMRAREKVFQTRSFGSLQSHSCSLLMIPIAGVT